MHGNWCGPGWTGGREVGSKEYFQMDLENVPCLDEVDCACKLHDESCAHENGCSKKADRVFIQTMDNIIEDTPAYENRSLRAKAKLMKKAILVAIMFRKHRRLQARRLGSFDQFPKFDGALVQKVQTDQVFYSIS